MTDSSDGQLFSPTRLGAIDVANRIVMAPLTRNRAIDGRIPIRWRSSTTNSAPAPA